LTRRGTGRTISLFRGGDFALPLARLCFGEAFQATDCDAGPIPTTAV
jgi:hypothetical protein